MPGIKLAVYQGGHARGVKENLALLESVLTSASRDSIDLVVFSELFLQGYCSGSDLREFAETKNGESFQKISQIAAQSQVRKIDHKFGRHLSCFIHSYLRYHSI